MIGSRVVDLLANTTSEAVVVLDNFVRGRLQNLIRALSTGAVRVVEGRYL